MRKNILAFTVSSILLTGAFSLAGPTTAPAVSIDQAKALIAQLGNDDFQKREEATEKLTAMGKNAVPLLKDATKSDDLEVKSRSEQILARIEAASTGPKITRRTLKDNELPQDQQGNAQMKTMSMTTMRTSIVNGKRNTEIVENGKKTSISSDEKGILVKAVTIEGNEEVTTEYAAKDEDDFKLRFPDAYKQYARFLGNNNGGMMTLTIGGNAGVIQGAANGQVQIQVGGAAQAIPAMPVIPAQPENVPPLPVPNTPSN